MPKLKPIIAATPEDLAARAATSHRDSKRVAGSACAAEAVERDCA